MNNINILYVQLVLKLVFMVMGVLLFLGDKQFYINLIVLDKFGIVVVGNDSIVGVLVSFYVLYKGIFILDVWQVIIFIYSSNDIFFFIRVDFIIVSLNLNGFGDFVIVEYYINNMVFNFYGVWVK